MLLTLVLPIFRGCWQLSLQATTTTTIWPPCHQHLVWYAPGCFPRLSLRTGQSDVHFMWAAGLGMGLTVVECTKVGGHGGGFRQDRSLQSSAEEAHGRQGHACLVLVSISVDAFLWFGGLRLRANFVPLHVCSKRRNG